MLIRFAAAPIASGVRVSPAARRAEPNTSDSVSGTIPGVAQSRYSPPAAVTCASTPYAAIAAYDIGSSAAVESTPMPSPSHRPWRSAASASRASPAPTARASSAMIPVGATVPNACTSQKNWLATPTPAMALWPSDPTMSRLTTRTRVCVPKARIVGQASSKTPSAWGEGAGGDPPSSYTSTRSEASSGASLTARLSHTRGPGVKTRD